MTSSCDPVSAYIRCSVCQSNKNTHDSAWFLVHFQHDCQLNSQCTQDNIRFISQPVSSSLCIRVYIYMLIFVNDFLLCLRIHCSVRQDNKNTHDSTLTSCSCAFSTWLSNGFSMHTTHSVHLTACKFKFVYPYLYAHLCENDFLLRLLHCSVYVYQDNKNTHDSALISFSFSTWLSNGFSMTTLGSSHSVM